MGMEGESERKEDRKGKSGRARGWRRERRGSVKAKRKRKKEIKLRVKVLNIWNGKMV